MQLLQADCCSLETPIIFSLVILVRQQSPKARLIVSFPKEDPRILQPDKMCLGVRLKFCNRQECPITLNSHHIYLHDYDQHH